MNITTVVLVEVPINFNSKQTKLHHFFGGKLLKIVNLNRTKSPD